METYIALITIHTSARDIDLDDPEPGYDLKSTVEAVGGKLVGSYFTLGRFDAVAIMEVPNANAIRAISSVTPADLTFETLPAFPERQDNPELTGMIKKILEK